MMCFRARGLLSAQLDGQLDPGKRESVERHVRDCVACGKRASGLSGVRSLLRSIEDDGDGLPEIPGLAGKVLEASRKPPPALAPKP